MSIRKNKFEPFLDAAQGLFFARQLEMINANLYATKYPDLEAEMLLPNRIPVPAGADAHTWRQFDERGQAVPMSGHEDGAPTTELDGAESSAKMQSWISAYGYNIQEIQAAEYAKVPLDQMRANAARNKIAIALNYMALLGYTPRSIYGLFNQPSTLTATIPADGTGTSALWSTKTADLVLRDMFNMVDSIPGNTLDIEGGAGRAMNFVMPKVNLRLASVLRLGTSAQDTTVLEFFKRQRPNVSVMGANYLPTAGSGGISRSVVYDPAQVSWLVSYPFQALPPEQKGFRFVVNCHARGGGVITPYPKSIIYGDGM